MPVSLDNAFGIHDQSVLLRSRRAEILAANLANADTPGYKARDIDFQAALSQAKSNNSQQTVRPILTHSGHMPGFQQAILQTDLKYRIPTQPSLDGNTVESQFEQSEYTENALHYLSSMRFLNGKIKSLLLAIKGQ